MQEDATARKRFLREAKLAAALDHPFICKVYEIGEEGGNPLLSKLSWKTDFGQVKSLKTKLRNEILLATSRIQ